VVDQYSNYEVNNKHLNGRQTLGMNNIQQHGMTCMKAKTD
jgi:hypothetical protein